MLSIPPVADVHTRPTEPSEKTNRKYLLHKAALRREGSELASVPAVEGCCCADVRKRGRIHASEQNKLFSKDMRYLEREEDKPIPHKHTHALAPPQRSKMKISLIISNSLLVNT